MYIYSCYTVLSIITIYVILISVYIYRRSYSLVPIVPLFVIYFWSIFGAWTWIPFKLNGGFYFYEDILFEVKIDEYYFFSLLYYSLFLFVFSICEASYINRKRIYLSNAGCRKQYLDTIDKLVSSKKYHFVVYSFLLFFLFFSYRDIASAIGGGVSAYQLSRFDSTTKGLTSLVQFCGDTFVFLSIPLLFSRKLKQKIIVLCLFGLFFSFNFLLGNRSILLCGMLIAFLLYSELNGVKKALRLRNIVMVLFVFVAIQLISFFRGLSTNEIMFSDVQQISIANVLLSALKSSEQYASQMSMYGVLKYDVDFTYGSSVLFLISTFIPAFVGIQRPMTVYQYYIKNTVGSRPELGVTINHATGWYLNFGVLGIILGAMLWAYTLKYFIVRKNNFVYMYIAIVFSVISIQMIRDGGLESYKGGLFLDAIIPMVIIRQFIRDDKRVIKYNS